MRFFFILFFTPGLLINAGAQEISISLHKSACVNFRNHIYVVGYEEAKDGLILKIQKYNAGLEKVAEKNKTFGKYKPDTCMSHW